MSDEYGVIVPALKRVNQPLVTDEDIWNALEEHEGNIARTARSLDMPRNKLVERIERRPELIELLDNLREEVVDDAETNQLKRARSGVDPNAERFVLQTLGKRRGWNTAVGGINANGDITVNITRFAEVEGDDA